VSPLQGSPILDTDVGTGADSSPGNQPACFKEIKDPKHLLRYLLPPIVKWFCDQNTLYFTKPLVMNQQVLWLRVTIFMSVICLC